MKTVLTIAGSDSIGGAGIQADIKTLTVHKVYAMSCITALTAQNTLGISDIMEVSPEFFENQMNRVFSDIRPDAVKTGMLPSADVIAITANYIKKYQIENLVVDPVMVSTSGTRLMNEKAEEIMYERLFPLAKILTPNLPEAELLSGMIIKEKKDQIAAAKEIGKRYGCAVLCKGGHSLGQADDFLYDKGHEEWISANRIQNPNTHGTGCTLSSAVAANLARGYTVAESVHRAKHYITGAIGAMLNLGKGNGPLNHMWDL